MTEQPASPAPEFLTESPAARRYDLDWLRILAILILLFYHTGMIYVSWGFHIKSAEHSQPMEEVMRWLHRWRMPLLFFISGGGTFFALKRRTFGSYAGERFRRLFIPLLFGMLVVVPPQIYVEWLFRGWYVGSYADFYPDVFRFQPYKEGVKSGAFSWHHLWFILYLLLYSLLSIPLFRWLRQPSGQRFTDWVWRLVQRPGGALWGVLPLLLNDWTLGPFFPNETHALINDWAYFVKNLLLFWLGYLLISRPDFWRIIRDQRRYFLVATGLCTVLLYGSRAVFGEATIDNTFWLRTIYGVNSLSLTWFSVLATIGYGYRYLDKNHPVLPYLNEAVYPFYILHQTAILLIGYYVLTRTRLSMYDGFLVISFTSLAICVALYVLLIRPFRPIRFLFGLKP